MPSLDLNSSRTFWTHYMNGSVKDIIAFLESKEHDLSGNIPEILSLLEDLGNELDDAKDMSKIKMLDLIKVASLTHMSQKLRLMQCVDTIEPGTATRMISYAESFAETDPYAKRFLERNTIFERVRILQRVYQPSRLELLMSLYE